MAKPFREAHGQEAFSVLNALEDARVEHLIGNETTILSILQAMLIHGMIVQGTPKGDHYGPVAIGAPDERAELQSRDLGRRVAELAARLSG